MTSALYKAKQFLEPTVKVGILVLSTYFIYSQWKEQELQFSSLLDQLNLLPLWLVPCMLLISLGSWLIESRKWQFLTMDLKEIRFRESVIQNLIAQAASFITPWRVGEFATKAFYFSTHLRKSIFKRVLIGNLSQMSITVVLGALGAAICFPAVLASDQTWWWMIWIVPIIGALLYLRYWEKVRHTWLNPQVWPKSLGYSLLRYLVFSSNWWLMFYLMDADASFTMQISYLSVFYLLTSLIPVFQWLDISVKWTAAILIFPPSFLPTDSLLLITSLIWCTNTIFPTLVGCLLLVSTPSNNQNP
ncbi:lysylphosphatidylglycerol synthase domain-containing protein [Nonlabens xiamenensis]|uniref:lysylphosphatidylglycerol synthase domain-containing protein n=1 Tax=Nonlabens xiamenensis TaxID=2341043 RepID=UPI000F60DD17|nr:lysylphosphatidylglycerol synthase domain-containing protein [Nonlabens xiamenensis]